MSPNYSTFGDQRLGGHHSAPSYSLGASTREQAQKIFLTQKHMELAMAGKGSPGPAVYTLPPSVGGKQPDGRRKDPPSFSFGTAARFRTTASQKKSDGHRGNNPAPGHYGAPPASVGPQVLGRFRTEPLMGFGTAERKHVKKVWISQEHQKVDMHGMGSPGPATYGLKSTMGKQDESSIPSPPTWVFSSAVRIKDAQGKNSPGPAAYTLPQSVGPQPDSKKPHSGTPIFGTGTRDQRAMIYLGPEQEKGQVGKASPGPAAPYNLVSAVGKQVHSKTPEMPNPIFSREDRWRTYNTEIKKNSTPGPGTY